MSKLLIPLLLLLAPLAGCGPAVSEDELGEIVFELPEVPGADEPYPLSERLGLDETSDNGEPSL